MFPLRLLFLKVPFQKYERKVCEEEQGLDHGKEGETPPAGEVCLSFCYFNCVTVSAVCNKTHYL